MSFSAEVKEELSKHIPSSRHCRIAELAAILSVNGQVSIGEEDKIRLSVQTENVAVARKFFTLVKKTYNIDVETRIHRNTCLAKTELYHLEIGNHDDAVRILQATKHMDEEQHIAEDITVMNHLIVQRECCKRAFIRGMFLTAGSISDPQKSYHLEIVCASMDRALLVQKILQDFELDARIVGRKKNQIVYIKEGSQIVEILGLMEAGISLMNLENIRIRKEISNNINRKVNCETANISKTVSAAVRQVEDIRYIQKQTGFSGLTPGLEEIADLRLRYPDASLKELGEMLVPPVGKSGVNHRLRKLSEIAETLRANKEER